MNKPVRWKSRHTVLSILFVSWIVSFMDRMAMSITVPYIAVDFHLSPLSMGVLLSSFFAAYSISQIPGGILADIFGIRKVSTIALLWWSAFTLITGAVGNLHQMLITRFLFGLGEGVYPACVFKAVAVWFPAKERATANGIRQAAGPLGSALSPLILVFIMSMWGWRAVFYALFVPGIIIAVLVWTFLSNTPSESSRVSAEELAEIEGNSPRAAQGQAKGPSIVATLKDATILKYCFIVFAFDIAYWGFTTWLPAFLVKARGFSMAEMGIAASFPFFAGVISNMLGGWTSDRFFPEKRRTPIILSQLASALLLYLSFTTESKSMLVMYQTLAGFSLNFFFTAFWAMPMNAVPKEAMGVASGLINMGGQIAAFISPIIVGYLVEVGNGDFKYIPVLMISAILVSCAVVFSVPNKLSYRREEIAHGSHL